MGTKVMQIMTCEYNTVQKQLCMIFSVVMKIIASLLSQGSFLQISQCFTEKLLMALIQYQKLF